MNDRELEIVHETTYETASMGKPPDRARVGHSGADSPTADALRNRQAEAKAELSEAIISADLDRLTALRAEIRSLPDAIQIAEVRELQLRLRQIELERKENAENIKLINAVRKQKHVEYADKVKALEPYQQAIAEWDWKLSLANNDGELLRMEAREKRAALRDLSESMRSE